MKYSTGMKICAAVLSIVSCMVCLTGLYTTICFYEQGFYRQGGWNYYETYNCSNQVYHTCPEYTLTTITFHPEHT